MGAARAAALIAAADHGLAVYEYSPKKVKMAVVGNGNADKKQVAFMVRALLGLAETPPPDAADALAIGIAHLQASDPLKAKLLERRLVYQRMSKSFHLPEPIDYEAGLRLQDQHVARHPRRHRRRHHSPARAPAGLHHRPPARPSSLRDPARCPSRP